ncbi:hypothetical protein GGX14DRAFT_394064 [Mycena pura]|uniref:Uncharacterized protein n=1 Tax=Mycena pura TaxID=153505 RepID=A0AAD6VHQ1_9AGAR|nr:hypothetical protein GGX14DRAFT_394064 [Mycena pura]
MTQAFEALDLDWESVRFMLVHTETLLSGWAAHRMLFPGAGRSMFACVGMINLFVPKKIVSQVFAYFNCATKWTLIATGSSSHPHVSETFSFSCATVLGIEISVHVTCKESPRCTVFRFPLSACFVHFDGCMVVVPYASPAMHGLAIPNGAYLKLSIGNTDNDRELADLEETASDNGVQLCTLGRDHRVFSDLYTLRSTMDNLSKSFMLRDCVWGLDDNRKVKRYATIWSLRPPVETSADAYRFFVHCVPLLTDWSLAVTGLSLSVDAHWSIRYHHRLQQGIALG